MYLMKKRATSLIMNPLMLSQDHAELFIMSEEKLSHCKKCECDEVFRVFEWHDIRTLESGDVDAEPGVYALRLVNFKEESIGELKQRTLTFADSTLNRARWRELSHNFIPRVERLKGLDPQSCPIIYLGATGKGRGNLRDRFKDLSGIRHTIFYPVFCLLSTGWEIEYGWKTVNLDSFKEEDRLNEEYRRVHHSLPCLVKM